MIRREGFERFELRPMLCIWLALSQLEIALCPRSERPCSMSCTLRFLRLAVTWLHSRREVWRPPIEENCRIICAYKNSDLEVVAGGTRFCYDFTTGQDAGNFAVLIRQLVFLYEYYVKVLTKYVKKRWNRTTVKFNWDHMQVIADPKH